MHAMSANVTPELLLGLYEEMLRIRRFEEAALQSYQKGHIAGFCHLYIGQEAAAAQTAPSPPLPAKAVPAEGGGVNTAKLLL